MVKVITYGTYDMLHYGHIRLLERAKALGDYLVVGVTADDFDRSRGKINVQQPLVERIEAVRALGIADEIIVEEYEGQKIDDIKRLGIDIFTVGSDWKGKFDYLKDYCKVVYLDRTEGVSSSEIRAEAHSIRLGVYGDVPIIINKYCQEASYVNGLTISSLFSSNEKVKNIAKKRGLSLAVNEEELFQNSDAVFVINAPEEHYLTVKNALLHDKHVICEAPLALKKEDAEELFALAKSRSLILMESIKTAYSTAYNRLCRLVQSGKIGKVVSISATCTSLRDANENINDDAVWGSFFDWGPTALLPVFQLLGTDYSSLRRKSFYSPHKSTFDLFTKIDFEYPEAVATIVVAKGVKSEGNLIVSGTKGYVYVPSPWWKTDYFEVRYENPNENQRYFYQLDGEGIRFALVAFLKAIELKEDSCLAIDPKISVAISGVAETR